MLLLDDDEELPEQPGEGESRLALELGESGLRAIDAALLQHTRGSWLKVARVVADALKAGGFDWAEDAPIELHARRMIGLVRSGVIEAQGNVRRPRWSEVRLATDGSEAEPPPAPMSKLLKAVIAGELSRVKALIEGGANVSEPDRHGGSPLHRAAVNDHAEIVELLLRHGAVLEARGMDAWTALHLACVSGSDGAAVALVRAGADVNSVARGGSTPLHLAVIPGKLKVIEVLLAAGASPDAVDANGNTPAAVARAAGRIDLAELIERARNRAV